MWKVTWTEDVGVRQDLVEGMFEMLRGLRAKVTRRTMKHPEFLVRVTDQGTQTNY